MEPAVESGPQQLPSARRQKESEMTDRKPCCSVGWGGDFRIPPSGLEPGCDRPYHITWLPHGYGPTHDDYVAAVVALPAGCDVDEWGFSKGKRHPLIEAICEAIETHMASETTDA
jgi:hypothetical protein